MCTPILKIFEANNKTNKIYACLVFEQTAGANDVVEKTPADMGVDGGERVVQQVDVAALIDGARQRHALLLTARQVDALKHTAL